MPIKNKIIFWLIVLLCVVIAATVLATITVLKHREKNIYIHDSPESKTGNNMEELMKTTAPMVFLTWKIITHFCNLK